MQSRKPAKFDIMVWICVIFSGVPCFYIMNLVIRGFENEKHLGISDKFGVGLILIAILKFMLLFSYMYRTPDYYRDR